MTRAPAASIIGTPTRNTITVAEAGADLALLRLLAWLSPAFPTGGFAYSHGLEWSVENKDVRDSSDLAAWILDIVEHGSGRNDAILARHAHRAVKRRDWPALEEVKALASATCFGRERHLEAVAQGQAFLTAASAWFTPVLAQLAHSETTYAVAVGGVAAAHGIVEDSVAIGLVQTIAASLVSSAVRLIPLGQQAGLGVLAGLEPALLGVAAQTATATLDDLGGAALRADLAALQHETQYTRLFRT